MDVAQAESVAVLGPSGSGKTTLLALCAGFVRPSSGSLTVLDDPFEAAPAPRISQVRRTSIGIVRQHYHLALPRDLTVEEIVGLPLQLLGRADTAGVAALLRAAELSGGEQQRVAVCAALVKKPRLLLADEPTGELDEAATRTVVSLLLELTREAGAAAALMVTHDPTVAAACTRTIHIRGGRLAAEGTTRPVLIVDDQGWLRLPRAVREEAGVGSNLRRANPG